MSLADTVPILGPLLADAQFRWWLLGIYLAIGPVPEDIPAKDPSLPPVTKWRWGGLLRVALVGAVGHSKLADRVGSLEHVMGSVVTELRGMRDAFERNGVIRPAFGSVDEPIPPASVTQGRRSVPSRAQL